MYIHSVMFQLMDIIWDNAKNEWLQVNRSVSFEEISGMILGGKYMDIIENPARKNQQYFVMHINKYTWVVPFIIDSKDRIMLKTAFPSRKFHKRYGGKDE